jgi:hypothetical protein
MSYLIVIILIVVLAIISMAYFSKGKKVIDNSIQKLDIDKGSFEYFGTLTCGHPEIDKPIRSAVATKNKDLLIFENQDKPFEHFVAKIPFHSIKNIHIEDASTVQNRVTVGRLLTVGVFAFAWTKKDVKEMSYLVIEWNDGRFEHETVFEFIGQGAVGSCNERRNKLIRFLGV